MPFTRADFIPGLVHAVRELQPAVDDHLADQGGVILEHVLLGDVGRFCLSVYERREDRPLRRCLDYLDQALREGDDYVENAVSVSFVETLGPWDPHLRSFIDTWPQKLREEALRQTSG